MGGNLAAAIADVVAGFEVVAGRATSDPTDVVPPCVYVPPPDLAFTYAKRRAEVTWSAYLVASSTGPARSSSTQLAELLDAVAGLHPFTTAELFDLTLPGGGPPALTYRLTWAQSIPIGG